MARIVIIYNDIVELNHMLEERGLRFKLHMRDTCGSQSFWIEPTNSIIGEDRLEEMQSVITEYFSHKGVQIQFLDSNLEFVFIQEQ